MQKANVKEQVVMQKVVMPGHDPASMNLGAWIAGQARNDSLLCNDSLLRNDSLFHASVCFSA